MAARLWTLTRDGARSEGHLAGVLPPTLAEHINMARREIALKYSLHAAQPHDKNVFNNKQPRSRITFPSITVSRDSALSHCILPDAQTPALHLHFFYFILLEVGSPFQSEKYFCFPPWMAVPDARRDLVCVCS